MSDNDKIFETLKKRGSYYNYFFNNLTSEKPLSKLDGLGFFKEASTAIRKDGYISYPRWSPVEYLIKIADKKPKEVMDILLNVTPNDNQAVHGQFIEAAVKMPAIQAKRIVPNVITWLQDPNLHLIPYQAADLISVLVDGNEIDEAIKLTKQMLVIKPPQTESDKALNHPRSRIDSHEIEEFLENQFQKLFNVTPVDATKIVINSLKAALRYKGRDQVGDDGIIEDYSDIWIPDFEKEINRSDPETVLSYRLFRIIDSVEDQSAKKELLKLLLAQDFRVFRRIAVACIGDDNPDSDLSKTYSNYIQKYGNPIGESGITSWTGPESPLSNEDFNGMTTKEIIRYLTDWKPSGQIMSPSLDGLGYQLNSKITQNPKFGTDLLEYSDEISIDYLDHVFSGLDIAARNKLDINWEIVFESIRKVLARVEGKDSKSDENLILAMTRLIESGVDSDLIDLSDDKDREVIFKVIARGLEVNDPNRGVKEKPFDSSSSPDIVAINSTRGVALFTLVHVMKRASRQTDNQDLESFFSKEELQDIVKILDEHLDITKEPSFAVRTVYSHELPYIWSVLPKWTETNLGLIFPNDNADYFRVNAESFIRYSQVYFPIVDTIRPILVDYMRGVKAGKIKDIDTEDLNHLVGKILIYYLNGIIELDDDLIKSVFELNGKWAAEAIEFIGRNLKDLTKEEDQDINTRAMALWDFRKENSTPEENSYFGLWLICDGMEYDWRKDNFIEALKKTSSAEMLWQVFDWLERNIDEHTQDVANIFDEILRTQPDQVLRFTLTRDVENVLQKLAASGDTNIQVKLKSVVDRLLSRNVGDYRSLLK